MFKFPIPLVQFNPYISDGRSMLMPQTLTLLQILAMTMFGEAAILQDVDASMAVGHVFMNRLEHNAFPNTPEGVAKGFHAFAVTSIDDVISILD